MCTSPRPTGHASLPALPGARALSFAWQPDRSVPVDDPFLAPEEHLVEGAGEIPQSIQAILEALDALDQLLGVSPQILHLFREMVDAQIFGLLDRSHRLIRDGMPVTA